jgi:hypothetical protein
MFGDKKVSVDKTYKGRKTNPKNKKRKMFRIVFKIVP